MSHERAQAFARSMKEDYRDLLRDLESVLLTQDATLLTAWRDSVGDTGYPPNSSALVLALATLRPIIESMLDADPEDILPGLHLWFATLLKEL